MTANLQIVTDERRDVLRVPNAALRFRPVAPTGGGPVPAAAAGALAAVQPRARPMQEMRQRLVDQLQPTTEQLAAIDRILKDARASAPSLETGASETERREAFRQFRQDIQAKIAAALDPERQAKLVSLVADSRPRSTVPSDDAGTPGRVYRLDESGRPQAVALRLGSTDGNFTEVLAGTIGDGTPLIVGGGPRGSASAQAQDGNGSNQRPRGPRLF
jgi:HlyD family secretion protein